MNHIQLPPDMTKPEDNDVLAQEIADLEQRLAAAKAKAKERNVSLSDDCRQNELPAEKREILASPPTTLYIPPSPSPSPSPSPQTSPTTHFLLLLSDSALPLGSFAFSSGLESYLSHGKALRIPTPFSSFLPLSLSSYASTTLPFLLAAHRNPSRLAHLDDTLDATIICTVGRRASVAQGRALLSIWDRSFVETLTSSSPLRSFAARLKRQSASSHSSSANNSENDLPPQTSAHLAPLFGVISAQAGLSLEQTAYIFMLGHVKALVSAAVRAGMFGPYQAQKTLASSTVQELISAVIRREWDTPVEEAGQCVPVMDLWFGRHEVLYSRIFNS